MSYVVPVPHPEPMSDSPYVKFDRKGTPYVEYADLRRQPEVRRQLEAARRVLNQVSMAPGPSRKSQVVAERGAPPKK